MSLKPSVRLELLSEQARSAVLKSSNKSDFIRIAIEEKVARDRGVTANIIQPSESNFSDGIFDDIKLLLADIKSQSQSKTSHSSEDELKVVSDKLSLIIKMVGEFKGVQPPKINDDAFIIPLEDMEKRIMSRMKLYSEQILQSVGNASFEKSGTVMDVPIIESQASSDVSDFEKALASGMNNFSFSKKR